MKFENRVVAFIDILGFKSIVENSHKNPNSQIELANLVNLLKTSVPDLNGTVHPNVHKSLIPKHLYISDSIILSAPLTSTKQRNYNGLSTVVMRVIQLTHILLKKGYLIRGGISIGDLYHTNSNIVGVPYQEAYLIETKVGVPAVKLSNTAQEYWSKTEGPDNKMCIDYKGCFIVNGLHDWYIPDKSHGAAEKAFKEYTTIISNNIDGSHPDSVRYKWWWFKEYLDSEIKRNAYIIT